MFIVTGSSSGMGNAIVNRLLKNGYEVSGISRNIPKSGSPFKTYQADVSDKKAIMQIANELKAQNVTVSGLINCAGLAQDFFTADWTKMPAEEVQSIFGTNIIGVINTCQAFVPLMNSKVHTPIINISSLAAHANSDISVYASSKYAVNGFTRSLSRVLRETSIRPNCIAPGMIRTEMTKHFSEQTFNQILYFSGQTLSSKTFTTEDICDVVDMLIDEKSNSLTGQTFHIGGY
jgi:3-oxoacyl-[acyl-carrier protein] reductase